jgi:flavin-dependent dehydrogenase
VLDAVIEEGTPAVRRTDFHYGEEVVSVSIRPTAGVDALYAPRRTVLDSLIVDAAIAAGATVRFGITVTGLERDHVGRVSGVTTRIRE